MRVIETAHPPYFIKENIMKFENTSVYNFENAIRGMRLPMNSGDKSDSYYEKGTDPFSLEEWVAIEITIGNNDLDLMQRLIKAGTPHDKFMRQIFVSVDITAPLYLWKELDQYKVGTTTNSQSTMHKLATTPITIDCFETDDYEPDLIFEEGDDYCGDNPFHYTRDIGWVIGEREDNYYLEETFISFLETLRKKYLETKDKRYWKELLRWLPESWLQTRTWTTNYEVLRNIVHQRQGHKLTEWQSFIDWTKTLPYAKELIFYEGERDE